MPMQKSTFEAIARNEAYWWFCAEGLRKAAEAVFAAVPSEKRQSDWPPVDPGDGNRWERLSPYNGPLSPYLLLAGFALENLIKGIRVRDDATLIREDKRGRLALASEVAHHDLVRLAGPHGPRDLAEVRVLTLLSHASVAYGRYSLPKNHEHSAGLGPEGPVDGNEVSRVFNVLYDRWAEELMKNVEGDPD